MKFLSKVLRQQNKDTEQSVVAKSGKPAIPALSLLFFIVDWSVFNLIFSMFDEEKVPVYFISKARGTATSDVLDILGIGANEKAVITCLVQPEKILALLKGVRKKLGSKKPGAGIAFTVPLSAINNPILQAFNHAEENKTGVEQGAPRKEPAPALSPSSDFPNALLYSIINRGYSDEFMNTARKAGATGGTILHARAKTDEGVSRFFGILVQEERDVILMLTSRDKKKAIMQAISEAHGLDSKTQGLILSLPVDKAVSLSFEQDFNA